jgi:type IV secretion system protein VirB2
MKSLQDLIAELNIPKLVFALTVMTIISTEPSFAQNFNGVNAFMSKIVSAITGPIGISISSIAVIAIGFSFMTGRMDWTFAVSIVLGIAIVFGGAAFLNGVGVSGG